MRTIKLSKTKTLRDGKVIMNVEVSAEVNDFFVSLLRERRESKKFTRCRLPDFFEDITNFLKKEKTRFNTFCTEKEKSSITIVNKVKIEELKIQLEEERKKDLSETSIKNMINILRQIEKIGKGLQA